MRKTWSIRIASIHSGTGTGWTRMDRKQHRKTKWNRKPFQLHNLFVLVCPFSFYLLTLSLLYHQLGPSFSESLSSDLLPKRETHLTSRRDHPTPLVSKEPSLSARVVRIAPPRSFRRHSRLCRDRWRCQTEECRDLGPHRTPNSELPPKPSSMWSARKTHNPDSSISQEVVGFVHRF